MDEQLEQRLSELETRLAFQEHALQELSDALAESRQEEGRNALRLIESIHALPPAARDLSL